MTCEMELVRGRYLVDQDKDDCARRRDRGRQSHGPVPCVGLGIANYPFTSDAANGALNAEPAAGYPGGLLFGTMRAMRLTEAQDTFFADYFRLYPVNATEAGNHEHDGRWPDLSEKGRQQRLAFLAKSHEAFDALDPDELSDDDRIDRDVLLRQIDALRFNEEELDELSWAPIAYSYLFGGGLFALLSREFAPMTDRLRSVAARLRDLPHALDDARANLERPGGRAVSAFHTEKAIKTMPGVADLARSAVEEAEKLDNPQLLSEVRAAADQATEAVDRFVAWLRDDLTPRATGDFRLGRDLYERKFHHALKATITPDELERRAAAAYDTVLAEMARIANELWPKWIGHEARPEDPRELIRRVLDAIASEHPQAEELLDFCTREHARIEEFVRERDLIGLSVEPLDIIWTPPFMRAFGGAMLLPPGPLDKGLKSFFAITPPPDDWTDEQVTSMLREDNARALRILTIHEATPGHYLQLGWSNRCRSLPRAVFYSGVFAEGWAVYVTQVMMDVGYGAEDPALMLAHWKYALRSVTNTLMDIRIHAREPGMTEEEAMDLMVNGGFQERAEASEKWSRARLSSTQLCEYFLGGVEMTELEREARRRAEADGERQERPEVPAQVSRRGEEGRIVQERREEDQEDHPDREDHVERVDLRFLGRCGREQRHEQHQ
jgi:uncharacterized protein (DUF885 family)